MEKYKSLLKSIGLGIAIVLVLVIYAYGFSVTDVNFETTREEERLNQLTRILRALAHPNIFVYEQEELEVSSPFYLPCPAEGVPDFEPDTSEPHLVITPPCAGPREIIQVEGFNLWPNTRGPINFIPPSGATLTLGLFETDAEGYFNRRVELPNRQPVEEAQPIKATARRNLGRPSLSPSALTTIDKIIETVFLALLATTFGTLLAIPVSFIAARNLMAQVKSPLTSAALSLIGWPLGILLAGQAVVYINQLGGFFSQSISLSAGGVVISLPVIWVMMRWAMPQKEETSPELRLRVSRGFVLFVAGILSILFLNILSNLGMMVGNALVEPLGNFGFLGNFIFQLGDSLRMVTPAMVALGGGGLLGSIGSRIGQTTSDQADPRFVKALNFLATALAGAVLFALVGAGIDWFYQIDNLAQTLWIPGGVGAVLGIILAAITQPKEALPIGNAVYYVVRTILNAIRSVEPLVMVIVFVVWVGIGPFAGALALGLHTVAALAKLFSEQVESILPGPLEAVQATGANRLQTIVYAVVPQIIPPYISFTMYRWDINVRMSTIIGFAGGGGIGFLLQQNIRLLDYRAASTQMLAIALVVASMDYVSSVIRERYV